jgi:hypothetical protein
LSQIGSWRILLVSWGLSCGEKLTSWRVYRHTLKLPRVWKMSSTGKLFFVPLALNRFVFLPRHHYRENRRTKKKKKKKKLVQRIEEFAFWGQRGCWARLSPIWLSLLGHAGFFLSSWVACIFCPGNWRDTVVSNTCVEKWRHNQYPKDEF